MQAQLDVYEDGMTDDHEEMVNVKAGSHKQVGTDGTKTRMWSKLS